MVLELQAVPLAAMVVGVWFVQPELNIAHPNIPGTFDRISKASLMTLGFARYSSIAGTFTMSLVGRDMLE